MRNKILTVTFVDFKTPELASILIRSFEKFATPGFSLKFVAVENSDFDLARHISKDKVTVINRLTSSTLSHAHGEGLEESKKFVDTEYVFTCHSDVCVTSREFFDEIESCIDAGIVLAGVCEDKHPDRVRAYHCSGLLVRSDVYKSVSMHPSLPKIDTTDRLTLYCRDNNEQMRLFRNTYNDADLVDTIDEPYRGLGKNCGVDRCVGRSGKVMYMHQGRGTTKYSNNNYSTGKLSTESWISLCENLLRKE